MTEQEFLSSDDPQAMLGWLRVMPGLSVGTPSDRKLRLFACACCRAVAAPILPNAPGCIDVAERYADGVMPTDEEVDRFGSWTHTPGGLSHALQFIVGHPAADRATQAALLREVVGDPFRATFTFAKVPAKWGGWLTPTILSLARAAYDERDFGLLPILADALTDACCTDAAILAHLRSPGGPHVRGCRALDLMLGRQ